MRSKAQRSACFPNENRSISIENDFAFVRVLPPPSITSRLHPEDAVVVAFEAPRKNPGAEIVDGFSIDMPNYPALSDEDVRSLVEHVKSLQ